MEIILIVSAVFWFFYKFFNDGDEIQTPEQRELSEDYQRMMKNFEKTRRSNKKWGDAMTVKVKWGKTPFRTYECWYCL